MKILLFFLSLFTFNSMAQVTQEWIARYNNTDADWAIDMAVDANNNIYVLGQSAGIDWDYATVKYNSSGTEEWVARYDGPGHYTDYAYAIAVNQTGDVYVTGWGYFGTGTHEDWATVKYNTSGVQQWVAKYNGPANSSDCAYAIAVDPADNIYVTGNSMGISSGLDFGTVKYNNAGVQQWAAVYEGLGDDVAIAVGYDINGNVYVTGYSAGSGIDYLTIKYNSSGVQQWAVRYDGIIQDNDLPTAMFVDPNGNVYVTGFSAGIFTGLDYVTIKYNTAGVFQWAARYSGPGNRMDHAFAIYADQAGNVYVSGWSIGDGTGRDYLTVKYYSSGIQQWSARYNGPGNGDDEAYSMTHDNLNNIYVTGRSLGNGTNYDYATVKYNSAGAQQWVMRYNDTSNSFDQANSVVVDGAGSVYVTGNERNGFDDFATVKYSQSIGINPINSEVPKEYELQQNYPNPFNPVTNINFSLPKTGFVKLIVYDAAGREAAVLFNGELSAGSYNYDFDASNYASGIYFYKLESNDFTQTKKMVLIK